VPNAPKDSEKEKDSTDSQKPTTQHNTLTSQNIFGRKGKKTKKPLSTQEAPLKKSESISTKDQLAPEIKTPTERTPETSQPNTDNILYQLYQQQLKALNDQLKFLSYEPNDAIPQLIKKIDAYVEKHATKEAAVKEGAQNRI